MRLALLTLLLAVGNPLAVSLVNCDYRLLCIGVGAVLQFGAYLYIRRRLISQGRCQGLDEAYDICTAAEQATGCGRAGAE
jgi:hypothetical protein